MSVFIVRAERYEVAFRFLLVALREGGGALLVAELLARSQPALKRARLALVVELAGEVSRTGSSVVLSFWPISTLPLNETPVGLTSPPGFVPLRPAARRVCTCSSSFQLPRAFLPAEVPLDVGAEALEHFGLERLFPEEDVARRDRSGGHSRRHAGSLPRAMGDALPFPVHVEDEPGGRLRRFLRRYPRRVAGRFHAGQRPRAGQLG